MNLLWLSKQQAQTIVRLATESKPAEVCGLLVGNREQVREVIPIQNIAINPSHRYVMDSSELAGQLSITSGVGQDLIGFYHSHPQGDPILSATDWHESLWPGYVYLVVGLKRKQAGLAAWEIRAGKVLPVRLHIGDDSPEDMEKPLTNPQRIAIIVGGIIALMVMLALSLSLLPPAPSIP